MSYKILNTLLPLDWTEKMFMDTLDLLMKGENLNKSPLADWGRAALKAGRWWYGCEKAKDKEQCIRQRMTTFIDLYHSIDEKGYTGSVISIFFDGNGQVHIYDGYHRVAIMKYLKMRVKVNCRISTRDPNPARRGDFPLVKTIIKLNKGKNLYQPCDDPRLKGFRVWRHDSAQRLDYVLKHRVGKTVLDLGCCYSRDTEILTDKGWKLFKDITKKDAVATLNLSKDLLEYQNPTRIIKYQHNEKMFHQRGKSIDLLVTSNHRMLVMRAAWSGEKKPFELIKAEKLLRHVCYKRSSKWNGIEKQFFYLPAVTKSYGKTGHYIEERQLPMDSFLKFMGFWISEGHSKRHGRGYEIQITQKTKEKNKAIIRETIKELGYKVTEHNGQFIISNKQLYTYLAPLGHSKDRYIPQELKNLSSRQLKILLYHLILGDGSKNRRYYTSSPKLADDVQEIILKSGWASTIAVEIIKPHEYEGRIIRAKGPRYAISITKKSQLFPNPNAHIDKRKWVDYAGLVYCVTVPNGIVYVRRNGKSCWCGNSEGYFSRELAKRGSVVTALDTDKRRVAVTRYLATLGNLRLRYHVGSWQKYLANLKKGVRFDNILFLSVFHHDMIRMKPAKAFEALQLFRGRAKRMFVECPLKSSEVKWLSAEKQKMWSFSEKSFVNRLEENTGMKVKDTWYGIRPLFLLVA